MGNWNTPWSTYDYATGLSAVWYRNNHLDPANYVDIGDGFCQLWYRRIHGFMQYHLTMRVGSTTALGSASLWAFQFPESMYDIILDANPDAFFTPAYLARAVYTDASGNRALGLSRLALPVSGDSVILPRCNVGNGTVMQTRPFTWGPGCQMDLGNMIPALDC